MRKNVIFAVIVAIISLASCQKENAAGEPQSEELVFTATIENTGTKTTINADKGDAENGGKIYWVKDDEITITDKDSNTAVYVAQSGGSTTTTFKIKSGETALGEGPYTASYGITPSTSQSYTDYYSAEKEAKNLYMTAPSTETRSFTFTAACGLMKINLTASGDDKTISGIKVFGKVNSSDVIYTLTCNSAQDISSAKDFFIALPAGSYKVFKFTNKTGHICYKTAKSAIDIADNVIQPVTLTGIVFNDILPGNFSVSSDMQVRFSKGNLYWDGSAYHFESAQNVTYSTFEQTAYDATHVCHFFWVTPSEAEVAETAPWAKSFGAQHTQTTEDAFFCGEGNSLTVDGQSGLYALSKDEWSYLIESRTSGLYKYGVKVADGGTSCTNCLIIAPDGYTGTIAASYTADAWASAESTGLVCLPAAGSRTGSILSDAQLKGHFWSSSPHENLTTHAYCLHFSQSGVTTSYSDNARQAGCSIRLVSDAQ